LDWKKTLFNIAPTLATAMNGPYSGAASKFLALELCGDENATIDIIDATILSSSPEQLMKLKELDHSFDLKMKELDINVISTKTKDRKKAVKRRPASLMPSILSLVMTVFIMLIVYALFYSAPPPGARDILMILLGVVIKEWSNSMGFWYNSKRNQDQPANTIK